jgi:uncharacterized Tic20 family protein
MAAPVVPIVFGGLIVWSIYRRVRRNIGRQALRPVRITISIVIFAIVSLIFLSLSVNTPRLMLGLGGGMALGALMGLAGLRLTKFETTDIGHFYTPNTLIGVTISVLFIGRMLYRFWVVNDAMAAPHSPPAFQSPLTFFIFGLTAGYYLVYYIGLFIHTRDKKTIAV